MKSPITPLITKRSSSHRPSPRHLDNWLARRAEQDKRLYAKYGKPLEDEHTGEFVAIGPDGQTILGSSTSQVILEAKKQFGSGNFALARVGYDALWKWLPLSV